ncbi:caffeine-induced death protein 2 [Phlyctema vagabunda]|uniref:Caffeine-induced death protein 2 n=1 Tax=Phlyctema vagabunda TaxID=108571 RepID=A0ABR4PBZ5_9HELO
MAQQPAHPELTSQFCFSTIALRDFLRISRTAIDDTINQNLNALLVPSAAGFDPSSTSTSMRSSRRQIAPQACKNFKENVLFPSWQARSDVLNFCTGVATSPDPDDPESLLKQIQSERQRETIVDDRLDPYTKAVDDRTDPYAKNIVRESRTETLANVIRQERSIERIVRARSWGSVSERCGGDATNWEEALNSWRKRRENRSS